MPNAASMFCTLLSASKTFGDGWILGKMATTRSPLQRHEHYHTSNGLDGA